MTIEEVAIKLARAVPAVVDCDRSLVCLFDADASTGRIAASDGYPPEMEPFLQSFEFEVGDEAPANGTRFYDAGVRGGGRQLPGRERRLGAALSVPIIANGVAVGRVVASVTARRRTAAARSRAPSRLPARCSPVKPPPRSATPVCWIASAIRRSTTL